MSFRILASSAAYASILQVLIAANPSGNNYDFPIYTNKPAGRQISGQHTPATTAPLSPEAARKAFRVPTGFEVRLFASEPEVVNPVAMTWDERGRLWVVELYEYPLGARPGEKGRDRIKILEDIDGDGRADKVTVFADGLNLATGILLGNGGVYVGQAPHLLFLKDTNGDDKVDSTEVVLTGFGLEDRHELLNGFTWGPDGQLYMTHGVFTFADVKDPGNPQSPGVKMNAAVARWHPGTRKFEVFADGTSNPWGVDFDSRGNAFVSACVIDHFFHMAPGGTYVRQSGVPASPYGYQLLPSIVDHKHHMAAYAGVNIYQGDQYPREWQGHAFLGNIHQNALNHDRLTVNGSSFRATEESDFLATSDGWFRPVSNQTGPDGAVWVMDWYDKYPCYQNANADPEGVDREYGRIWRIVHVGAEAGATVPSRPDRNMNLAKLGTAQLAGLLEHKNVWQRRTAQRLLSERKDHAAKPVLEKLMANGGSMESRLGALWTLHSSGMLDEEALDRAANDKESALRSWAARFTGERAVASEAVRDRLLKLAGDADATVRFSVAVACRQFASGSLTINTPPSETTGGADPGEVLAALIKSSSDAKDPLIPFMIWAASEPAFARDPGPRLGWLAENGPQNLPLSAQLARKAMRRLCDLNDAASVDLAVRFIESIADISPDMTMAAVDGLLEGQKGKALVPTIPTGAVLAKLTGSSNQELRERGRRLGTLWGDSAAILQTVKLVGDGSRPLDERRKGIQSLRQLKNETARDALLGLISTRNPDQLLIEALNALSEMGGESVGETLVRLWPSFSVAARRSAADTLVSRRNWARTFMTAMENKVISPGDVPANAIRALVNHKDDYVRNNAARAIGKFREADADKLRLIAEKRKMVLEGTPDLAAGKEVAAKSCLICHKFHGEGAEVGPDLTGVGRSSLEALLHNVIHPNEVIGKGYENVEIETKDGRTVSGRLVEDTASRVRLIMAGPKEEIVAGSNIASRRVTELSVMPEGLEQMPDADFRNLIWYILNPPQDKKPLTPERYRELIGHDKPSAFLQPAGDGESVALWNPEWKVSSGVITGAPRKESDFAGRRNVLVTHPFSESDPAVLEKRIRVPAEGRTTIRFAVASDEGHEWRLRARVDGRIVLDEAIESDDPRWKEMQLDLTQQAGREVSVRLENLPANSRDAVAFWHRIEVVTAPLAEARNSARIQPQ